MKMISCVGDRNREYKGPCVEKTIWVLRICSGLIESVFWCVIC